MLSGMPQVKERTEAGWTEARTGPLPEAGALAWEVNSRYGALASSCCSLSCGAPLDLADPGPGDVLVDLGCGRGADVIRAAGRVGPTGVAIGVDGNGEMLAVARASGAALPKACFVQSDLTDLDLPDETVDVVISNCTINHVPDKAAAFREVYRILVPGGRFVISDVVAEEELPVAVREDPAAWAACYGGAVPEADYLAAIRGAGFRAVEVLERSAPYLKGGVKVLSLTVMGYR